MNILYAMFLILSIIELIIKLYARFKRCYKAHSKKEK